MKMRLKLYGFQALICRKMFQVKATYSEVRRRCEEEREREESQLANLFISQKVEKMSDPFPL